MEDRHISSNHCGAVLFTARVVLPCAKLGIAYGRGIGQDNGTHSATRNLTETVYTEHCRYKRNQAQIACSIRADPASSLWAGSSMWSHTCQKTQFEGYNIRRPYRQRETAEVLTRQLSSNAIRCWMQMMLFIGAGIVVCERTARQGRNLRRGRSKRTLLWPRMSSKTWHGL